MLLLSAGLATGLILIDTKYDPGSKWAIEWAYSGGPQGARSLLTTIAGSMITASSVTFSLASVALSIAAQQYGSRVLRNYMRDRMTQVLLGTFTSTFVYSVLVVRKIRGTDTSTGFVPSISITVGIALSLVSLLLLVMFVHHISTSIKASHILQVIHENLEEALGNIYPSSAGAAYMDPVDRDDLVRRQSIAVTCAKSGYLQSIDLTTLLQIAKRKQVVIETTVRPGDHLISHSSVAQVRGTGSLREDDLKSIASAFIVGEERTPAQDIRYQFQQLTQVVIRSLSPAINDPFTAITGIDQIASSITRLAEQGPLVTARADDQGALRVIAAAPQLRDLLTDTVGHIATYGARDHLIMAGLRRILDIAEPYLHHEVDRTNLNTLHTLRQKIDTLERVSRDSLEGR